MAHKSCLYFVVLFCSFFLFLGSSHALIVTIDPGAGGTTFAEKTFTFNDLDGNGLDIIQPLEFVFSDSKHISLTMNSDTMFNAKLTLTFSATGDGFVPVSNGSLRHNSDILSNSDRGTAGGGNVDNYTISWYTWNVPEIDGYTFSKVYFNSVNFRTYPEGTTIESASLTLQVWGSVHDGIATVGPLPTYELTVNTDDGGVVTSEPSGISCGADCSEFYDSGTSVTLTAAAQNGYIFSGWSGDCSGSDSTCDVTMDQARNVSATFGLSTPFCWNLFLPTIIHNAQQ